MTKTITVRFEYFDKTQGSFRGKCGDDFDEDYCFEECNRLVECLVFLFDIENIEEIKKQFKGEKK